MGFIESVESRAQDGERSRQAEAYDGMSMRVDVHWSDKALKDMTDRDWRIFREDFNIQFRGNADTLPMRSWAEANIPSLIMQARSMVCCMHGDENRMGMMMVKT